MCGGGGGGGGCGGVSNRPVSRPPPVSVERPTFSSPDANRPKLDINNEDSFQGPRSVKKTKKPERNIIDRAAEELKNIVARGTDFVRDNIIGRQPVTETPPVQSRPNPVVPR